MQPTAAPVLLKDRADILDVLRGIALLGICLANYPMFSLYIFQSPEVHAAMPTAKVDTVIKYFHYAFLDGKFYSLFSLLFGIGFTIILQKHGKNGKTALGLFYRRLFILMFIGLAHSLLLWEGDILLLYALIGMLLPLFRHVSNRAILIFAIVLIISPLLFDFIKVMTEDRWNLANILRPTALSLSLESGITETNWNTWLVKHNSYADLLEWNKSGFFFRWDMLLATNRLQKVLGMFLIGLLVGRKMWYANLEENKRLLKKVRNYSLVIGLPTTIVHAYLQTDPYFIPHAMGLLDTLFYALSVIPMSLFYTTVICLLFMRNKWQKKLLVFAPVGRMALTNYIMQTLFGVAIFYGIGLGWGSTIGLVYAISIALAVYLVQLVYSNLWFKYFQFGPLEWLWRLLTYGKVLPILKKRIIRSHAS